MNKFYLGRLGELLTIQYLKAKGYKLLIHSYKRAHGEIDLIMQDKDVLVNISGSLSNLLRCIKFKK